jgi:hypothetical protein
MTTREPVEHVAERGFVVQPLGQDELLLSPPPHHRPRATGA